MNVHVRDIVILHPVLILNNPFVILVFKFLQD